MEVEPWRWAPLDYPRSKGVSIRSSTRAGARQGSLRKASSSAEKTEPPVGFEPTTARLRIESSTTELRWRGYTATTYRIGREVDVESSTSSCQSRTPSWKKTLKETQARSMTPPCGRVPTVLRSTHPVSPLGRRPRGLRLMEEV